MSFESHIQNTLIDSGRAGMEFLKLNPKGSADILANRSKTIIGGITGWTTRKIFSLLGGTLKLAGQGLALIPIPLPGARNIAELRANTKDILHFDTKTDLSSLKASIEAAQKNKGSLNDQLRLAA